MVCSLNRLHVNVTTNLQSLIYIFLVLLGFVNYNRKLTCGKLLFWDKTLTHYHHRTMSTWSEYEKSISAWIHHIMRKIIQAPGRPPFLTLHHRPTLEYFTHLTKNKFLQTFHTVAFPPVIISPHHWHVACRSSTLKQTKTSIGETHTTPSSTLCV